MYHILKNQMCATKMSNKYQNYELWIFICLLNPPENVYESSDIGVMFDLQSNGIPSIHTVIKLYHFKIDIFICL